MVWNLLHSGFGISEEFILFVKYTEGHEETFANARKDHTQNLDTKLFDSESSI